MSAPARHRLSSGQLQLLEQVARGQDQQAAVPSLKIPAQEYLDPLRFDLERRAIFERAPILVASSGLLATPGSYARTQVLDMPVLLTRDKQGVLRAFANVCMHRGTMLCTDVDPKIGGRIVCPYHAWTYGLDGKLIGVPKREAFPELDLSEHNLVELPAMEVGGLIWIGLKPGADLDFSEVAGSFAEDMDGMGLGDAHVFRRKTYQLNANWKLVQETMLDRYHVTRLHRDSVGRYFEDVPETSDMVGPHVRAVSGRLNFSLDDIDEDFAVSRRRTAFGYVSYPTGAIVASPRYISLCIVRPLSVERTDVDFYLLAPEPPADVEAEGKLDASFELMDQVFGKEDFWAAELGQQGLSSGVLTDVLTGGMERRIVMFRDVILDRIAEYERAQFQ